MSTAPQADGVHEKRDGKDVLRFERRLDHPVEAVWSAITEPSKLIGWLGEVDVDLVEGGRFTVRWLNTDEEGNRAVMHATITDLDESRLLETSGDIHGVLRWELRPEGEGTRLNFSSKLSLPDEYRTQVLAGWHLHLDALAETLAGGEADLVEIHDWERVHELYVKRYA
jgi:uncharacterized protein YndB with AHSA1/START domain